MKYKDTEKAHPKLYRLYYGFMLVDLAKKLGLEPTQYVKDRLHEIHKKYLKYPTTSGISHHLMSKFLFEVGALWACHGIFVRTKEEQPLNIEELPLKEIWSLL